jgi:hypothetical protein
MQKTEVLDTSEISLLREIGFSDFNLLSTNSDLGKLKIDIKNDIEKYFVGEDKDSLIYIIKNDSILKDLFKDKNREAEAIEDIKKKIKDFTANEENKLYISDLFEFLNKFKQYISEKNKDTKSIDDFINNFSDKLDKLLEEKLKEELKEKESLESLEKAKHIFRL